jgi:hypothetical protein
MKRKLLGICGVLLFGSFAATSGAFASTQHATRQDSQVAAEVCSVCDANCYRIYELESEKCNSNWYKTAFAKMLCRAAASDEHGRCRKRCDHNK